MLNTRGIEYPSYRFRPYSTLDEETILLAKSIGYDERSWNALGTNPWEIYSFNTIQSDGSGMVVDSIQAIGFTAEVWDCYTNHYRDYSWQQLADEGVVVFAVILGWSEEMWDGMTSAPDSEFLLWNKLSVGQQQAAIEFCFTQEIWDAVDLEDWDSANNSSIATLAPSSESTGPKETRRPEAAPSASPAIDPSPSPVIAPAVAPSKEVTTPSISPVADESSPGPAVEKSLSPVDQSTLSPTVQVTMPEDSAKPTPVQQDANDTSSVPSVDAIRYVVWDDMQESDRGLATDLGYEKDSWNTPGTADIEYYSIQGLYDADLKDAPDKISELGFTEEQWDCYVHHYISFSWDNLKEIGVDKHFVALGWSQSAWDDEAGAQPASEDKTWEELTDEERGGAIGLCYMLQTWDGYSLDDPSWKTMAETTEKPSPEEGDEPPKNAGTSSSSSQGRIVQAQFSLLVLLCISTKFLF